MELSVFLRYCIDKKMELIQYRKNFILTCTVLRRCEDHLTINVLNKNSDSGGFLMNMYVIHHGTYRFLVYIVDIDFYAICWFNAGLRLNQHWGMCFMHTLNTS